VSSITSKLNNASIRRRRATCVRQDFENALESDYVDLFLITALPTLYGGDFVSTWNVLESSPRRDVPAALGVSNFQPAHLDRLAAESDTVPRSTRSRSIPYFTNEQVREYGRDHGHRDRGMFADLSGGKVLGDPAIERNRRRLRQVTRAGSCSLAHSAGAQIVFPKSGRRTDEVQLELFDF